MALTKAQIDLIYENVLSRHATDAEQSAFSSLSNTESTGQIFLDIVTLPEATSFVDPVIRLYQGAFGRLPDSIDPNGNFDTGAVSGLWANTNALRSGVSIIGLAQAFVGSQEFLNNYGSTTVTPALITAFYEHILGRDPSSQEVANWVATGLDAAHILIGFTQSAEFIARSQASVNLYLEHLANGQHDSGPLPPPPPTLSVESDVISVNEGSSVTFTLQSLDAADFGKTFSYTLNGIQAGDIVGGQLSGSVTLDAQGLAHVVVTTVADHVTEGAEQLTIAFGALVSAPVTINDTSVTPTTYTFTSTSGEVLTGSDGDDTFVGVVDHSAFNDTGTFQNVIDVANGGAGFDTLELVVNQSNIDIVPNAPGVEELKVTDLTGANYNLSKMADIKVIASDGSTGGTMNFFNVQNIVNLDIENSDLGLFNMNVTTTTAAGTGAVDMNLVNSGNFNLNYHNSNGDSVVTDWAIHATGANNNINDLHGAGITNTFRIDGSGSLRLDLDNGDDTSGVTFIDASALQGDFTLRDLHANQVDIEGSVGDNDLGMHGVGGAKVVINTQAGDDTISINNLSGGTGNPANNGQTFNISTSDGDDSVTIDQADSDGDNATVDLGAGKNSASVTVGGASTVSVTAADGNNTVDVETFSRDDNNNPTAQNVTVTVGNGANKITVDTDNSGGNFDVGSKVTITAGNGGNNIGTTSGDAAVVSIVTGSGDDVINSFVDDGNSKITVNAGDGNNNVAVHGDVGATLDVTTGSGADTVFMDGGFFGGAQHITLNSGAGNDSVKAEWENSAAPTVNINLGAGDDRLQLLVTQQITAGAVLDGGDGFDTLANDSQFFNSPTVLGKAINFEALEVTDVLSQNINTFDFPGSNITKVVLDAGVTGSHIISGLSTGATVDIHGEGAGGGVESLTILENNSNLNLHDVLNLNVFDNGIAATQNHGNVNLGVGGTGQIETVNLGSFSDGSAAGDVNVLSLNSTSILDLHIAGTTTLTLDNDTLLFFGQNLVSGVDAANMTGGINGNFTSSIFGTGADLTFNAPQSGSSTLGFGAEVDHVTLGNGTNLVTLGAGNDDIHVGSGQNTITGGAGQDDIFFAAHSAATVDTIRYAAAGDSQFSLPDIVNGFNQATDKIDLPFNVSAANYTEVDSDATVAAAIATLHAGGPAGANVVLNITTGHLFIDANDSGTLTTAGDMEINLVGVTHLTAATFV